MDDLEIIWTSERSLRLSPSRDRGGEGGEMAWVRAAGERIGAAGWEWVLETIPSDGSVLVVIDPLRVEAGQAMEDLRRICQGLDTAGSAGRVSGREVVVPVCYEGAFAPDLALVARHAGMDPEEVVSVHAGGRYTVVSMGFSPGFGYLSGLDERLHIPRRISPRTRVPAGSVAIGGDRTGVYPHETPGGWNLIGRTAMTLFNPSRASPALLSVGDTVRFEPITTRAMARIGRDG